MTENDLHSNLKDTITGKSCLFLVLWAAGLILFYGITGYLGIHLLQSYKAQTIQFRQDWIKASVTGQAEGTSELKLSEGTKPVDVNVGIYINQVGEFSLKDNKYMADFDIWFCWTGEHINPGENFEIVDGQIEQKKKVESGIREGQQYERYRVRARMFKYINAARAPFNDEGLAIQIEDSIDDAGTLRYVADTQNTTISPQAVRRFLKVTESGAWVGLHNYGGVRKVHYRFIYALLLSAPGMGLYVKMFQGLFASVAIAFITLFIKPTHFGSRFSLAIGAFFAVIANNISIGTTLFISDRLSLMDMTCGVGLATIFFVITQSAISIYLFESKQQEKLSQFFDKVSFVIFLLGYGIVNILLPLAAKL